MRLTLSADERFLEADFDEPHRTLSWALVGAGFGVHRRVVWHYVRREELPLGLDPAALLSQRLHERGYEAAVGLLTARVLRPYAEETVEVDGVRARAVVTVGLGNALRAGDPPTREEPKLGTINVLCHAAVQLSDAGLLETMALAAEARTLALLELRYPSVISDLPATGTGTDCIVVACPQHGLRHDYAGKHKAVGAALGKVVHLATRRAAETWLKEQAR
jgi:adenosylcobinamide amidohydrolase